MALPPDGASTPAERFFFDTLPIVLGGTSLPGGLSTERIQIRVEGEHPSALHLGPDAGGDLTFVPGEADRPTLLEIVFEDASLASLVDGGVGASLTRAAGWLAFSPRAPAAFVLTRAAASCLRRMRGSVTVVLTGDREQQATLGFRLKGLGAERRCRATIEAATAVLMASRIVDVRRWANKAYGKVEGDAALLAELVEALFHPPAGMTEYLFVWHRTEHGFPLRFWIGPGSPPADADELHGCILESAKEEALKALRARFQEPDHVVECMAGTSWRAVEENFPGLYEH
jgi:hypothetical protein